MSIIFLLDEALLNHLKRFGYDITIILGFFPEQEFREFTFASAAMLHTRNNPGYFKGTVVDQAIADELGLERASPAATAQMTLLAECLALSGKLETRDTIPGT